VDLVEGLVDELSGAGAECEAAGERSGSGRPGHGLRGWCCGDDHSNPTVYGRPQSGRTSARVPADRLHSTRTPARTDGRFKRAGARVARAARSFDADPRIINVARALRDRLPGDREFGDPLSTGGPQARQVLGRRLAEVTAERPGIMRELGLGALQVFEHVSEAQGRGRGTEHVAIAFTDLVAFSSWALDVGDDAALRLLRDVATAVETPVTERRGRVVKRLGDGMMAVFDDAEQAVDAIRDARERLAGVRGDGYEPVLRAGVHWGRPRRIGGDYLGVDVNIAARLAQEADGDEILVSDAVREQIGSLEAKRKRRFSVKGVPKDLTAYAVVNGA
jgi:adenylate cyclase